MARAEFQQFVGLFIVLSILTSNYQARADTFLTDSTWAVVTVQCFAFAGTTLQSNYGLWWMQVDGLSTLAFEAADVDTTEIGCHFVSLTSGAHQWFPVYKTSGLAVACGTDCQWTIQDAGFFLHDPVANADVQVYSWVPPPDTWIEPGQ